MHFDFLRSRPSLNHHLAVYVDLPFLTSFTWWPFASQVGVVALYLASPSEPFHLQAPFYFFIFHISQAAFLCQLSIPRCPSRLQGIHFVNACYRNNPQIPACLQTHPCGNNTSFSHISTKQTKNSTGLLILTLFFLFSSFSQLFWPVF